MRVLFFLLKVKGIVMRCFLSGLLASVTLFAYANQESDYQQTVERIKPVGEVRIETSSDKAPVQKETGQAIYEKRCTVCHQTGLAGAPVFRQNDWKLRLEKKNITELTESAIKGIGAMPPKGTCSECSEEDIKNAIQYMLPAP